jgi:protein-L-isoaspartate(D-aspartate) O-methyltransferase
LRRRHRGDDALFLEPAPDGALVDGRVKPGEDALAIAARGRTWKSATKGSGEAVPDRSADLRRRYAAEIARLAGVRDPRIEQAFAAVPREDFAGPPPWHVSGGWFRGKGESDLARLYDDVLVAIDAGRGINNGQPSLHALSIDALGPKEGETIVQIGAGAGYYTAILARLVGPSGGVIAYEIEPDVAERARANLAGYPRVEVRPRSGVGEALPAADCIYVSAAASHPVRAWLDALNVGGRLLFPLQAAHSTGAMLLVTRPPSGDAWPARFLTGVVFIACEGAQDAGIGRKLDEAFRRGGSGRVRSLRFGGSPSWSDWLQGDGWALSTDAAG